MKKENLNNGSHTSHFPHHTSSDGITLIALVITIIVMLILVAVSVTMAINGGLFGYAKEGTDKTQAEVDAEQELASGDIVDQLVNGTGENSNETNNDDKTYVDISELSVGDYISGYPVEYENVASLDSGSYYPQEIFENKWRVLSTTGGVVRIISAGVPLSYYHPYGDGGAATSVANLTTGFLTTEINSSTATKYKFYKCGFDIGTSTNLSNVFKNDYTDKVQSLTYEDLSLITGATDLSSKYVNSESYAGLLAVPCEGGGNAYTCLASKYNDNYLWYVYSYGAVWYNRDFDIGGVRPVVTLNSDVKFSPVSEENWINDTTTWEISFVPSAKITLDKTDEILDLNETLTITATTNGTEKIQWTSSDETLAKVEGSGEQNKTATVTALNQGTVTITAIGENVSAECTITIKITHIDDSYVEYDVSYIDMYSGTKYTANTGWRILTQEENDDGTYDIEIISTGIPARLFSSYMSYGSWGGSTEQRESYAEKFYLRGTLESACMGFASGLYYNFEKISFYPEYKTGDGSKYNYPNLALYDEINGIKEDTMTGAIFKASIRSGTVSGVRSVTLADLTGVTTDETTIFTDRNGLFVLSNYTPSPSYGSYWLASPASGVASNTSYYLSDSYVYSNGGNYYYDSMSYLGLRPIVSITGAKMEKNGDVWKIVE